jgi:ribosomal protein L18E
MENKPHPFAVTDDIWMVPCFANKEGNQYQPLCQPFNSEVSWEELQVRHPWVAKEDQALKKITKERGTKAWSAIARELNNQVHNGVPLRRGKQCRERYYNHLNTGLKKGDWAAEEDQFIVDMQGQLGNKWSEIAKGLPGRTENQVKNRWKSLQKKMEKRPEVNVQKVKTEEYKIISPLLSMTPNSALGFVPFSYDSGFSSLADSIKTHYGFGEQQYRKDKTPSPSSFFNF